MPDIQEHRGLNGLSGKVSAQGAGDSPLLSFRAARLLLCTAAGRDLSWHGVRPGRKDAHEPGPAWAGSCRDRVLSDIEFSERFDRQASQRSSGAPLPWRKQRWRDAGRVLHNVQPEWSSPCQGCDGIFNTRNMRRYGCNRRRQRAVFGQLRACAFQRGMASWQCVCRSAVQSRTGRQRTEKGPPLSKGGPD